MNIPLNLYLLLLQAMAMEPDHLTHVQMKPGEMIIRTGVKSVRISKDGKINPPPGPPYWELASDKGAMWLRYWSMDGGPVIDLQMPNILPGGILYENKVHKLMVKET